VEAGGSVEHYNQELDDLVSVIYTFTGVDSDFSIGTASGDEDNDPEWGFGYSSLSEESDVEQTELQDEAALLNFTARLSEGLEAYIERQRRPLKYKIIVKEAPRTKQRQRAETLKRTKALQA